MKIEANLQAGGLKRNSNQRASGPRRRSLWSGALVGVLWSVVGGFAGGQDCNSNGVDDSRDLSEVRVRFGPPGGVTFLHWAPRCAVDVDGDGDIDLVTSSSGGIDVLENDGSGRLGPPVLWSREQASYLAGGDLNADGAAELVVANGGSVVVLSHAGGPSFARSGQQPLPLSPNTWGTPVVADLDGDGDLDVAVSQYYCRPILGIAPEGEPEGGGGVSCTPERDYGFSVFRNDGGGGLSAGRFFETGRILDFGAAGDLDGDGDTDLAFLNITPGTSSRRVYIYENTGAAGFRFARTLDPELNVGDYRLADVDGDLDADFVLRGAGLVLENIGGFEYVPGSTFELGWVGGGVALADIDRDGDVDLLVGRPVPPEAHVFLNDGAGDFSTHETFETAGSSSGFAMIAADIDSDERLDLITSSANDFFGGNLSVLRNVSGTTSRDCNQNAVPDECDIDSGASADCDADGVPDECQTDCNENGIADVCDIAAGTSGDCNENAIPDECDIAAGTSFDEDGDGVPDSCTPRFHRGDPNESGDMDLSDAVYIFGFEFLGDDPPRCAESADVNNDGEVDISDGISLLQHLFLGGAPPADPGPPTMPCDRDPDAYGSDGFLGCDAYDGC